MRIVKKNFWKILTNTNVLNKSRKNFEKIVEKIWKKNLLNILQKTLKKSIWKIMRKYSGIWNKYSIKFRVIYENFFDEIWGNLSKNFWRNFPNLSAWIIKVFWTTFRKFLSKFWRIFSKLRIYFKANLNQILEKFWINYRT